METIDFDPARAVESVVRLLKTTADDKRLDLSARISPRVPAVVRGDPTRLRQILVNLVGNAIKFTERGSVEIAVRLESDDDEHTTLRFEVRDTGIGMTDETKERLFHAFVQADGSTTRRFGGTGLGLAISQRLARLMGGSIDARSAPGEGSTFTLCARFGHSDAALPVDPSAFTDLRGLRALVIDDDRVSRRGIAGYLSSWGLATAEAEDAETGLALLAEGVAAHRPYDIVVIDYIMPRKDGMVLGAQIHSDPGYGKPATIMVTAFDAQSRRDAARELGFTAYLSKPIEPSALYDVLIRIANADGGAAPQAQPSRAMSPAAPPQRACCWPRISASTVASRCCSSRSSATTPMR